MKNDKLTINNAIKISDLLKNVHFDQKEPETKVEKLKISPSKKISDF
tara:strand:+ start:76 stop:216 length:141 start_codon:yes stop_codon:yes gene_type:complete